MLSGSPGFVLPLLLVLYFQLWSKNQGVFSKHTTGYQNYRCSKLIPDGWFLKIADTRAAADGAQQLPGEDR